MVHIKIKRGKNIPILGAPKTKHAPLTGHKLLALDVSSCEGVRFNFLVKLGDKVKTGQPLLEDKALPGRFFVSPASGKVHEINRGLKRRLLNIVIESDGAEEKFDHGALSDLNRDAVLDKMMQGGIFARLRMRPCNLLVSKERLPKSIFVSAVTSAPFAPPPELEVEGNEEFFQYGLDALATIAPVHLVRHVDASCQSFTEAKNVECHTAEGPHPIGNASVHIAHIDPILRNSQTVWTATVNDVVAIGKLLKTGKIHTHKVIAIAGEKTLDKARGFYKVREGVSIRSLAHERCHSANARLLSGDPLTGERVLEDEYLRAHHNVFCAIPEAGAKREMFHFFRLGRKKYTATRAYLSGHLKQGPTSFTTNQHGEDRAFVDGAIYDKVMPLPLSTMPLIKAILAEEFDKAEELGLLEVASEDFALPSFICPSKIAMIDIVKKGLQEYANQVMV